MLRSASRWISISLFASVAAIALGLAWRCRFDSAIRFLPKHAPAEWITYPSTPDILAHHVPKPGAELSAVFRRVVVLEQVSGNATIQIRAAENLNLQLNGQAVPLPTGTGNWKKSSEINATRWLTRGTNEIQITVTNRAGPPALWFVLRMGEQQWISDASWEVSYADAVWQSAHLASTPRAFGKGNPMRSEISFKSAWQNNWGIHAALLLASISIAWAGTRLMQRQNSLRPAEVKYAALGGVIVIWIVMLVHNFTLLPPIVGFDANHHLNYIRIIDERGELPKTDEGWETHQPPLYYLACASLLRMAGLKAATTEGLMGLRVISLFIGLGQILLVFATLRLLFPNELRRPLLGTAMAATLPAHLYHAHYVTNETLLALLITASFYFALRVIRGAQFSSLSCVALGACMGAALMTKLSALVFLPVAFAAFLVHLLSRNERSVRVWAGTLVLPLLICLLIAGRYYWQMWTEGGPFANSSRWGYGSGWWQEDGYRTTAFYFRFGSALLHPLYSSFHSFWDGMYSTLWGDALCGGSTSADSAPPWNYKLLAIGYWLALVPTLAIAVGFVIVLGKLLRRPSADWLLLVGVTMLLGLAMLHFSLIAPGASQVRASFGLMLLVPCCALFAFGFNHLVSWKPLIRIALAIIMIWWALNSLAAHWIPTHSAQAHMLCANSWFRTGHFAEAARDAESGLRSDPSKAILRSILADSWTQLGKTNEAKKLIAQALAQWPNDPMAHLDVAFDLAQAGKLDEAVAQTRHALELAPDHPAAARQLTQLLSRQKRFDEAAIACRQALRVLPYDEEVHAWFNRLREGKPAVSEGGP